MQAIDMANDLTRTGPATEIVAEHLIGAFGGSLPHPQIHEQASDEGHVDLHLHAVGTLTEQMTTAQDALEPAEEEFNGMITNDKFCCTRWDVLPLSWWRRPKRLRG